MIRVVVPLLFHVVMERNGQSEVDWPCVHLRFSFTTPPNLRDANLYARRQHSGLQVTKLELSHTKMSNLGTGPAVRRGGRARISPHQ